MTSGRPFYAWIAAPLTALGEYVLLAVRSLKRTRFGGPDGRRLIEQMRDIGFATVPMACLVSFFIGGVLSLQTGYLLARHGALSGLGGLVGMSVALELSPVMMAILMAGRMGSSMAAELGSMTVYDEIDALRMMRIDPLRFLVAPRIVAMTLCLPVLALIGDVIGWAGGAVVARVNTATQLPFNLYFRSLVSAVQFVDVLRGLVKALAFGTIISTICCRVGLQTSGGPRGIGVSVTRAVVASIVAILVSDYIITRMLLI